jgi:hypothetical protein
MEEHVDNTFQLAFSRFGVAVIRDWKDIFVPIADLDEERPVLIYDYDAYCFLFCDAGHFLRKSQAWTLFADIFGIDPPPIAEPVPEGEFADIHEYMERHDRRADNDNEPLRPRFYNRADSQAQDCTHEDPDHS